MTIAIEADLIGLGLTDGAPRGGEYFSASSWLLFLLNKLLLISLVEMMLEVSSGVSTPCCGVAGGEGCCWMDLTGKVHRLMIGDEG